MTKVNRQLIDDAMSYQEYRKLGKELLEENKTTGENHSEAMVHYTRMNDQRMDRLDKTTELLPETRKILDSLTQPQTWLVLTEAWCGDAAQIVPVFAKMAEYSNKVDLKLILRDEHPDIMDLYLTKGGKSIPKLAAFNTGNLEELGTWGPRPEEAQKMVMEHKKNKDEPYSDFVKKVQLWYAKDKTESIQREFGNALKAWISKNEKILS